MLNTIINRQKHRLQIALALYIGFISSCVAATTWQLQPQHADVGFTLTLLGGLYPKGEFQKFSGKVLYDETKPNQSQLEVKIATSSLQIDLPDAFDSLSKNDFFKTKQYPYMSFKSKRVRFTHNNTAKIIGNLTFMGKTHPVIITAYIQPLMIKNRKKLKFHGKTVIRRSNYDFRVPILGLSDEIAVHLHRVLVPQKLP